MHPYLAIARGLNARGHSTAVGSYPALRDNVEKARVEFFPLRPDAYQPQVQVALTEELSRPVWEQVRLRSQVILPNVSATFEDLREAVHGADLLITSSTILPAALVAAKTCIPWILTYHMLTGFSSLAERVAANLLPGYGRWFSVSTMARPFVAQLLKPMIFPELQWLTALWRQNGLVYDRGLSPYEQFPPKLVLGLVSQVFAPWNSRLPLNTRLTGFPMYEGTFAGDTSLEALESFLETGEPPLLFTLGSTRHVHDFFPASLAAAVQLKRRALFLIGNHPRTVLPDPLPKGMLAFGEVPYSTVFPRAEVNIHHGGIGTTTLALRAGRPMLVVPRSFDQPDNAVRAQRLGVARVVTRAKYTPARVTAELEPILEDERYRIRATELAKLLRTEDGTRVACDAIEDFLAANI